MSFEHQRHQPATELREPREIIVACPQLRSNINLSRIVRLVGCCGIHRMIVCGNAKIDAKIARDAVDFVEIERRRSLAPALLKLREQGYAIIGLEQTTNSESLYTFTFPRKAVLVVGHERTGLTEDLLELLDHAIELPVYGQPLSYNVATATSMALYEYCRQQS